MTTNAKSMADGQPARFGDLALARLQRAGDAGKQRRFPPPVGGDEAEAVAGIDDEIKLGKQRIAQRHAEIADIDECHVVYADLVDVAAVEIDDTGKAVTLDLQTQVFCRRASRRDR